MRHLLRNSILTLAVLGFFVYALVPGQNKGETLRLGKDLRGGTTLVYSVQVDPGEDSAAVINQTIQVLEDRIDPNGLLEIQMVPQGRDRIEVSMPLPTQRVQALRDEYEAALASLSTTTLDRDAVERLMALAPAERGPALEKAAGGDAARLAALQAAAGLADDARGARAALQAAEAAGAPEAEIDSLAQAVAQAEIAYETRRDGLLSVGLRAEELRRALELSNTARRLKDMDTPFPSDRQRAIDRLKQEHPALTADIDRVVAAHDAYLAQRTSLDDPDDLKRLISAAGVPSFRVIAVPGDPQTQHPEEERLRRELLEKGPQNVTSRDARWCRINDIFSSGLVETSAELAALEASPAAFMASKRYTGEEYGGAYWVLCWDTPSRRLTRAEGDWAVASSFRTRDEVGRPAIGFEMDARGGRLLGLMTAQNTGNRMAVLLDEQVYTAPALQSAISRSGRITGEFSDADIDYIIKVLSAGSLQARVSAEPLSQNTVAPEFGLDNLRAGRDAGLVALAVISVFMVVYYYGYGLIAVVALLANGLMILGAMALARASFTLPGIAGVVLTFGMAVDANVLIYERIREELNAGQDLRTAVRLGFSKAMSSIVDGNVTNLIVCFVLANLGTQEIRGFAITLGIGVVTTLFAALVVTRLLMSFAVDVLKIRTMGMLPMRIKFVERLLNPAIDWIALRWIFVAVSGVFVSLGVFMIATRGEEMLDIEFRGGTQVTLVLEKAPEGGGEPVPVTRTRAEVLEGVLAIAEGRPEGDPLRALRNAEVIPINPQADGVTSDRFTVKTYATAQTEILEAVSKQFAEVLATRPPRSFAGREVEGVAGAPVFPVLSGNLGESIERPDFRADAREYLGGVAIVLEGLSPPPTLRELEEELEQARSGDEFSDTLGRTREVRILRGSEESVESAVLLVRDDSLSYFDNRDSWEATLATGEWSLTRAALSNVTTLASVQSFSAVIAEDFQRTAVVTVAISLLLILIYIWVRFGSVKYSLGAIVCLAHDVLWALGLIALAEIAYDNEYTAGIAQALGVEPFKIDLGLVAAILTIIGYSLNDTIIVMDRIRETKGRMQYASREVVNKSINETISRTVITSGTTLLAALVLYTDGGAGVKAFSFALLVGVGVGTYSSIAVAAPIVWSRKAVTRSQTQEAPRLA